VLSEKSFSLHNEKLTFTPHEKIVYDYCKKEVGMKDAKAVILSKFVSTLQQELLQKPTWSQEHLIVTIREILARQAAGVRFEREAVEAQLSLLEN